MIDFLDKRSRTKRWKASTLYLPFVFRLFSLSSFYGAKFWR